MFYDERQRRTTSDEAVKAALAEIIAQNSKIAKEQEARHLTVLDLSTKLAEMADEVRKLKAAPQGGIAGALANAALAAKQTASALSLSPSKSPGAASGSPLTTPRSTSASSINMVDSTQIATSMGREPKQSEVPKTLSIEKLQKTPKGNLLSMMETPAKRPPQ